MTLELLRRARAVIDELEVMITAVDGGALQRMDQAAASPIPTSSTERVVVASGISDPTAAAALAGHTDPASADAGELGRILTRMGTLALRANRLLARYPVATVLDADARATLGLGAAEPGCSNCAQLPGPGGGRRWEPIDTRTSNPVALPDDTTMWLCRWCRDRLGAWGRLPTRDELAAHHAGRRVTWPPDVPAPP